MMKKQKNRKGFTLAELLVVVAIIGILVAVSIPIFTAQKAKAIRATNQANIRAAKAAAMAELYSDEYNQYLEVSSDGLHHYIYFIYDVEAAKIVDHRVYGENINWDKVNAEAEG